MDSGIKRKRDINPRENASIFSILSFSYVFNAMRQGFKRDLIDEDIYEVLESYKSDKLGNRLDDLWKLELKKKHPWIVRPLVKMFAVEYMLISFMMLVAFSCLIFTFPIFKKGFKRDLTENDVYDILPNFLCENLGNLLEKAWQRQKFKKKPHLLVPLLKIFGFEYLLYGLFLFFINTTLIVATPLFTGQVVAYYSPSSTISRGNLVYSAVALCVCVIGTVTFLHSYMFAINQLSMKMKIACVTLLYRKCLAMNITDNGKTITLMTKDVNSFELAIHFSLQLFIGTVQTIIVVYLMYTYIGISAVIGTMFLIILVPFQVYLGRKTTQFRLKTSEYTDKRVRVTQEILTAIRIIKMYTWELFFAQSLNKLRKKEIKALRLLYYIKAIALSIGQLSSRVAFYICVMSYLYFGNHITAEKAFIVVGCFGSLRSVLSVFMPLGIAQLAELQASLKRLTEFLLLEEVKPDDNVKIVKDETPWISIKDVTVTSTHFYNVLDNVNVKFERGLTAITGYVGCGKSTLLKLILGDIKKNKGGIVEVCGKISYASQDPWIFPGTVRQNIIFGEEFNAERYNKIIEVCALKKDFYAFPEGDQTCVTDKGLNISRGQKTRINLARAVYRKADIYLLDDCLSAVDPHVAKHIFYQCVKIFLRDKVRLLVTHQHQLLREVDNILVLSQGRVNFQGNFDQLQKWNGDFVTADDHQNNDNGDNNIKESDYQEDVTDIDDATSKLLGEPIAEKNKIYSESKEEGSVKKDIYIQYFTRGGGIKMLIVVIAVSIIAQVTASWSDYFVSYWVDMEQDMSGFRFNKTTNSEEYKKLEKSHDIVMRQYSLVILGASIFTILRAFTFFMFTSKASINIHKAILEKIINAEMVFFDKNLSGNILNRFSRDLGILDEQMPYTLYEITRVTLTLIGILFVVSSINLYFIIPSLILIVILCFARHLYIPTGRSIRRLEGSTRSPIIGHLNATLEGLTTIRASKAEKILRCEFDQHQDLYNSVSHMHLSTTRAFGFYLDIISSFYITVIIFTFLYVNTDSRAGEIGLAITQSFTLTGFLQWGVRQWAELENQMTSSERVLEYMKLNKEKKSGSMIDDWPKMGRISYENISLKYSENGKDVINNLTFVIEPGKKIGIVGRTGAGKTSILSTLFRMYDYQGIITIDNVDIKNIQINLLRSKISIIPQEPVLFSGTIRSNLDPNGEHTDTELWNALQEVEIKHLIKNLHSEISDGGSNFSIGQRQLICLARAIIRKNTILVMDEATANVDSETDSLIQRTIQRRFSEYTVITIAHRLHTILNSDKVLVMESGNAVEFDDPNELLRNTNGTFYQMMRKSGLV